MPTAGRRRARVLMIAVSTGLTLLASACGGEQEPAAGGDVLRLATTDPRCTIGLAGASGYALTSYGIAETLLRPTADGTGVEPWVARSFEQTSPNQWRFELREGVRFHNGRALDAAAVVAALRTKGAQVSSPDPVSTGTLAVTGPLSFTMTTPGPSAAVPNELGDPFAYYVFDAAALQRAGEGDDRLVAAGIYTGPYRPASVSSQRIVTRRFDSYWGERPALREVQISCVPDAQARVAAVRSGQVDIAIDPPSAAIPALENSKTAFYARPKLANVAALMQFKVTQPPFNDPTVRRAFALAIDYRSLAEQAVAGRFDPANALYPDGLPWTVPTQRTNRDEARRLLDSAGWVPGADGIRTKAGQRLQVTYLWSRNADEDYEKFGVVLREQLRPLGVDLQVRETESTYDSSAFPQSWDAAVLALYMEGRGNGPSNALGEYFGTNGGLNLGTVSDPELDGVIGQLQASTDAGRRDALLRQAQRLISERGYAVVLGYSPLDAVVSPAYRNYIPNPKALFVTPDLRPRT